MSLIPFGIFPGHWGLKGKTREIAKAEYELSGYELECALCHINNDDETQYKLKKADIDYAYGKISSYEHDLAHVVVKYSGVERELEIAKLDLSNGRISEKQYDYLCVDLSDDSDLDKSIKKIELSYKHHEKTEKERDKEIANLKGEPWCDIRIIPEKDDPRGGYFDVDYNDAFIEKLHEIGYLLPNKDDVLDLYITDFCKSISMSSVKATMDIMDQIKQMNMVAVKESIRDDIDDE